MRKGKWGLIKWVERDLFSRSLKVRNVILALAPSLRTLCGNYTLVLQINLVTKNDKREVFRIARTSLDQKLIAPVICTQISEKAKGINENEKKKNEGGGSE